MQRLNQGVYPTMLTPFRNGKIDFKAVDEILEFYIKSRVDGVFAVCQSSEMFQLSLKEKVSLAKHIVEVADGRINVVASGHTSDGIEAQAEELNAINDSGVDAVVLVSNRLDLENAGDETWIENAENLVGRLNKNMRLGLYECPRPYKRLLSEKILDWCIKKGRFSFIKDTCCSPELLKKRLEQLKGSPIMLFNANAQTLYYSLKLGAAGYSGIMANFHPKLYVWLTHNTDDEKAQTIGELLEFMCMIANEVYPVTGKYALQLNGICATLETRSACIHGFTAYQKKIIDDLHSLSMKIESFLAI